MSTMMALPKDHPIMLAWESYRSTSEYANSFRWAEKAEHRDGSMWAAFLAGWQAAQGEMAELSDEEQRFVAALQKQVAIPNSPTYRQISRLLEIIARLTGAKP